MKSLAYALVTVCFSGGLLAQEPVTQSTLSQPDIDTVVNIHNFCVEQHSEHEEPNREKYLFNCVNADLQASAYRLFTSVDELKLFIKSERDE
ncbi:hypothetical protein [Thalassomonas actiniarum]|uniref:Uncharacterized protein n=1 Tax=Thalassomonas actiniarum TaxID=485447 RepID=A0AAF0BYI3_9GAMM|nr:hypothetical protein [Thalassomonas actiniarum]WDD97461.1 hypothetical protein SG35_019345 [Thalassomonas actiniarum]